MVGVDLIDPSFLAKTGNEIVRSCTCVASLGRTFRPPVPSRPQRSPRPVDPLSRAVPPRPEEILEPPSSSDALRPAWLVGFDGAAWDGQRMAPGTTEGRVKGRGRDGVSE